MPGYDRSRIVGVSEQDLEEFTCGICLEVFIKPTVTQCCGQTFCFECINEWLEKNNTCPNDRKTLTTDQLKSSPKMVTNLLSNMKIKCDFHEKGCNVVIKIDDLEKHKLKECDFNPSRNCDNCGEKILNHSDKQCIKNLIGKLTDLHHEYNQFKEQTINDQIESTSYIGELLIKFDKLEIEYNTIKRQFDAFKMEINSNINKSDHSIQDNGMGQIISKTNKMPSEKGNTHFLKSHFEHLAKADLSQAKLGDELEKFQKKVAQKENQEQHQLDERKQGLTATTLFEFDEFDHDHYQDDDNDYLSFDENEIISNIEMVDNNWWTGVCRGKVGMFPSNYVRLNN